MEQNRVKLSSFSLEPSLRCDVDYIIYQSSNDSKNSYSFKDLFELVPHDKKVDLDTLNEDFNYCEIGDTDGNGIPTPNVLNLGNRVPEFNDLYKKIEKGDIFKPEKGNILIAKVRPYLNKTILMENGFEKYFYTKAFIEIKPINEGMILYHSLRSIFLDNLVIISRQGKGYPTINDKDFKYLRFKKATIDPLFKNSLSLNKTIKKCNDTIMDNLKKRVTWSDLVNNFSSKEWSFSKDLFNSFGKGMSSGTQTSKTRNIRITKTCLSNISNSRTLRCSERFHNHSSKDLNDMLNKRKTILLGDVIADCVKGIQPNYDTNGSIDVVKISNLKNGYIDLTETEKISIDEYKKISTRSHLKKNDLILCSTGKCSLGRVDVFTNDVPAITASDNYVIRIDEEKYDVFFLALFLRSIFGIFQIERDYTGCTNQIHLYEDEIRKFRILDVPLAKQKSIIAEFNKLVSEQNKISENISNSLNEIVNNLKK